MLNLRHAVAGLAAVAAVLSGTPAVCADATAPNPRSEVLARKLFAEMHMDQMMSNMMRQMGPAMIAQARQRNSNLSDADAEAISEAAAGSMDDMMKKMIDLSIPLYATTFTEKELQDLVNFYDTPSGQAMLAKMPVLMNKMVPLATQLAPEMVADMTKRICAKTDCSARTAPAAPKT
jgi:uncharacterized protein